jgi:hypothetical protein
MHKNRTLYTYPEYQSKVRGNYLSLGLICQNTVSGKSYIFRPVPCCAWIPEGRKKYYNRLYKRSKMISASKKFTFCTLTYDTKLYSAVEVSKRIKSDIDKFFKRLDYRKSKPEYFYVIELTDQYYCHIHLIFDRYIHKSKIHASWFAVTGSISTKIKSMPYKQALFYCMKYVTRAKKQSEDKFGFLFSHVDRLWSCSRKFFIKPVEDIKKWFAIAFFRDDFSFLYSGNVWTSGEMQSRALTDFEIKDLVWMACTWRSLYYLDFKWSFEHDQFKNVKSFIRLR